MTSRSSPENEDAMFFSSPGRDDEQETRANPADEVIGLVAQARCVHKLSPGIRSVLANPTQKANFLELFARRIQLLKSRSQAFEDGHVTVYDKTLLTLTRNGNDLENAAAIEYFCEEFLAIGKHETGTSTRRMLGQAVELSTMIQKTQEQEDRQDSTYRERTPPASTFDSIIPEPSKTAPSSAPRTTQPRIAPRSFNLPNMEPRLSRLMTVYEQAQADFLAVQDTSDTNRKVGAAKFLRDTAENTLLYLKDKNSDPIMLAELEANFNMAKLAAVSLTGGKKRKFDNAEMEKVRGVPRGPSYLPSRSRFAGNPVGNRDLRRGGGTVGGREFSARRYEDPARAGPTHGRGHSGQTFGYPRHVDSYHPY